MLQHWNYHSKQAAMFPTILQFLGLTDNVGCWAFLGRHLMDDSFWSLTQIAIKRERWCFLGELDFSYFPLFLVTEEHESVWPLLEGAGRR